MISRFKLEALTEAISHYSGYANPESDVYIARNPGGLKAFSPLQLRDAGDRRVFISMLDGWQALLYDADLKLKGESRARLRPHDTLVALAEAYGQTRTSADAWAKFLRKALRDPAISAKTPIEYFFEDYHD